MQIAHGNVSGRSRGTGVRHSLLAVLVASLFGASAAPALAAPGHDANEHRGPAGTAKQASRGDLVERGTRLSNGLLQSLKAFERAPERARAQRANELRQAAIERRRAMLELIEADPARALALAMPAALRDRLPKEARDQVEEEIQTEGLVVGMVIDDLERGTSEHPVFLQTDGPNGSKRLGLHWADRSVTEEQAMALIDKRVRVRGLRIDDRLLIGDRTEVEMAEASKQGDKGNGKGKNKDTSGTDTPADSSTTSTTTTVPSAPLPTAPLVSGEQRTLVILANFSDKKVSCTATDVHNRLFGTNTSVDRILRESSRDAVSVAGDVVGPFTIPYSGGGTCDYQSWGAAADAAARAAGVSLAGYSRISYAMPSNGNCGWSGIANLGGALPTRSWVLSCSTTGLFAHEISHNLRFHHASTPSSEYGDNSDPMGYSKSVQMNAANRVMAGWLSPGNVIDAASSGTYTLAALAAPDTGAAQVVRLPKNDTREYYYLSLRQSIGLDANLASAYRNVVSVHKASGTMPSKTVLVAQLAPGQTFNDAANALSVTTQSVETGAASVSVQMTGPACSRAAPTIGLSPASQTGAPGSTLQYKVTVTNQNSSNCASSTFALSQSGPEGFAGAFANPSLALAPGASATTTWSVASPAKAADGVHAIVASVAEPGSSMSASKTASYVVYSDGSAPTVNISYPASGAVLAAKPMSLSADVYDSGGIARVEFSVNGAIVGTVAAPPYQVRWNPKKAQGAQTLVVRAIDRSGNAAEAAIGFTLR